MIEVSFWVNVNALAFSCGALLLGLLALYAVCALERQLTREGW